MKKWLTTIPSVIVAGLVALPVLTCPLCWPLYAGILSVFGISFVNYTEYVMPITIILLLISLFPLAWKAKQRRGYLPFILGVIASGIIIIGKFYFDLSIVFYIGAVILFVASIWNIWPQKNKVKCNLCDNN